MEYEINNRTVIFKYVYLFKPLKQGGKLSMRKNGD